ncbi:MAG: glycosyltransferase family 2 protein, partial [Candidatus Korarchaeota archaeon]|nr:glycosyltransferase family 2 protein [Candidatus Korarchaeota archaeon]
SVDGEEVINEWNSSDTVMISGLVATEEEDLNIDFEAQSPSLWCEGAAGYVEVNGESIPVLPAKGLAVLLLVAAVVAAAAMLKEGLERSGMGAPPAGTSYFQAELEAWRTLLSHALGWLIVALYVASTVVLTAYALWYIASLAGYLSRGSEDAFLPGGPRTPAAPRGPRDLERGRGGWGWPRVAVVYPVYNDYEVLASLEKALDLDYPDYLVIVVDDSSDRALSLEISKYSLRSPHRLIHVRRWERRGLKAGALNDAALLASHYGAKYMLILDADFEPPRLLLKTLVAAAERHQADVVQGHQRHYKGSHTWFGSVYRAGMAGATIFMAGRASLGMFPIFTGSVGLLRVDRVLETGFKEGSLSEDLRWTIDLVSK